MKSILAFRRALSCAGLLLTFLTIAVPCAFATHLRGGSISWKVIATTATTYTVQFTFTESQRWSYPNAAGSCTANPSACPALNSTVVMETFSGGTFTFGDGSAVANPSGTVTSINQAEDYDTATFTFTHVYTIASGPHTAYFYDSNRISTLKIGANEPEYISTYIQNYPNASPVASTPAILAVPLLPTTTFNISDVVSDIDPNANLVYRLSTVAEIFGSAAGGPSVVPCPSGINYTSGGVAAANPPGFSVSAAGIVTWNTAAIQPAITSGSCGFGVPAAGDLWTAQIMVEAHNKTTNALITQIPIDLLMKFVSPVGALPTITINPTTTQTIQIGTPVSFTATGNSTNAGVKVTLNASGVPAGSTATGLNATVTPPASSTFNWTPSGAQAGTYVITYTVTDSNLQQATASHTIVVATLPTISCSTGITVPFGSTGLLSASVFDPSNELLNVVWTVDGSTVQTDNNITAYPSAATDSINLNYGAVGPHSVQATATDPHGVAVSCSTSATVTQANQTITFGTLPNVVYGAPDFALNATASSGLAVSYAALNNCSITASNAVHITGAGSCQITASQAGNASYSAAANVVQTFNIGTAAVTVTGGSGTAQYDGTQKIPSACSVSGSFTGDVTCANAPATVGPDAGTTAIVPTASSANLGNFAITAVNGSYIITQAPSVTTVSCPASVTYNGTAQTPCTATVTGIGGLSQPVSVGYTLNLNVGTATASANFAGDTDHTASSGSTTFVINPASLTVTAGSYSGTYDGNMHSLSACTVGTNYDGLTCSNNPAGPVGPDAGSGIVTATIAGPTSNYSVTVNQGVWSITPLTVALTGGSYSGVYDGSVHAPSACTSGYAGVTCANNPAAVGPGVGSGAVAPVVSFVSGVAADYTLAPQNGAWSITQAPSGTSISCPVSVVYNGAAQTPCTATATGVGGLSQSVAVTYSNNVNAGTANASATFAGDANHAASGNSTTFPITPAVLTATAGSYSGTYDGNAHALSACVVSGAAGVTCTNSPAGPVGPDAGSGTVTPVVVGTSANYTVTTSNGSWSITPLSVSVTAGSYNAAYDGHTHAPSACTSSFAGVTCANSPSSIGPGVGSGTVSAVVSYGGGIAADYHVTSNAGSYTISRAPASVTPNAAGKVYGAVNPVLTGTLSGFLAADGVAASYSRTAGETVAGSPYTISATLSPAAALANYAVTYNTAAFTITRATPTVTWVSPASISYGTPLSATQLNATASVGGTFVYAPGAGTLLTAGTQTLSVLFTPTDSADYTTATGTTTIVVLGSTVTIGVSSGTETYPTWNNFVMGPAYTGYRPPTGTVTLYNNGVAIVTLPLGGDGKAYYTTQPPLNAGVNNLTVSYSGDSNFPAGVSAVTTITVLPAPVNFQASCQGAYVYSGTYQCQISVSASTPTPPVGNITYSYDGGAQVSVPLNGSGNSGFTLPGVPNAGSHTLIIGYAGQGNYAAAASLSRPFTTQPGQTQLQVYPSTYYTAHGSSLTLSGSATTPSSGVPAGNVTFYDNGTAIGTVSVGSNGAVSLTVSNVSKGQHTYYATFAATSNYAAATSGSSTITAY